MPHVVPGCEIFEPGRAFKWQGPFPRRLLATHSHAKQPSSASQSAQHAAKLLALVHANALCVQEMSTNTFKSQVAPSLAAAAAC
jgi:hypothetical protein